ncbi:hypothetical protein PVAND_014257 [Polypedilum vanderplanki]|uniref:RING-type domain-containing protein n=1 Tax=Polypedilum vanderplanki TaxID=319348 RepID=A0A9J6CT16_POLVA|nr:hypothetical protein PVAND_014257 [Polypedilum vanderplanki]
MKPLIIFCILSIAKTGGSIDTRDSQSNEKQKDFINNGVVNTFAGLPAGTIKTEPKLETLLEISDINRYITLAFLNVSWFENGEEKFREDDHEKSKYGMGRVFDAEGKLVHISDPDDPNDHTACNDTLNDSFGNAISSIKSPWIALIKRGGCDFEKKIWHVYIQRAVGVIIYNNNSGAELNYMKITKKELLEGNITSVFTTLQKGQQLAEIIKAHGNNKEKHIYISIKAGHRFDKKSSLNHRSSVLFVTISFIIVMIISMLWLIVYYYQRFRYLQSKENEQKMDSNKAKEALKKIPTKTIKTLSKEIESDCCAVCIEAYRINDVLRCLPCKHEFHRNCIDPWLLQNYTCPLCKCRVLKQYGFVITSSQESIIQLELDDEDEEESDIGLNQNQRRRYSVSPMPQIVQRSAESQTSGRSSPSPSNNNSHQQIEIILVHKANNECSCTSANDKKAYDEHFSGYATYPVPSRKNGNNKCSCDLENAPQNIHQTLDFPKTKKNSKRPTILAASENDQQHANFENNSNEIKN